MYVYNQLSVTVLFIFSWIISAQKNNSLGRCIVEIQPKHLILNYCKFIIPLFVHKMDKKFPSTSTTKSVNIQDPLMHHIQPNKVHSTDNWITNHMI